MTLTYKPHDLIISTNQLPGEKRPCLLVGVGNEFFKVGNISPAGRKAMDILLDMWSNGITQEEATAQIVAILHGENGQP